MANYFDDFRNRMKRLLKIQEERKAAQEKKEKETEKPGISPIPIIIPQIIQQEVIIQREPIDAVKFLPNGERLPPPYEVNEFKNLLEAVYSARGTSEKNAKVYELILESALATSKPLLELYSLIPQIWSGSSSAISDFRKIIDQSSKSIGFRPENIIPAKEYSVQKLRTMSDRLSGSGGFSPCGPLFFIKPDVIHKLHETIYFISNGNERFSQNSMSIVNKLWKNTQILDSLNVLANSNKAAVYPELFEYMDGISESFNLEQNIGKIEEQKIKSNGGNLGPIHPSEDGTWFPPEPGFPFPPMGPDGGPGMPSFPVDCQPIREYCQDVLSGPSRVYRGEMPVSVSSSEIRRISATAICGNKDLIIEGVGFGNVQGNRGVVFGTTEVAIRSWSDGKIVVVAPLSGQGTVCIGIIDRDKETRRKEIHKINQKAFGELVNAAGPCLSLPGRISDLPYKQDSPPCTGVNQITVGKPIIRLFNINNSNKSTVETGSDLIMKWIVENATSLSFSVSSSSGSAPRSFPSGNPTSGNHRLGKLTDKVDTTHTYTLVAKNSCGDSEETVEIAVTSRPILNVLGIEAIQSIQKFDWDNPSENNSVFLVSNKTTMVRVYAESGMTNGFDFGAGPNKLGNVQAKLTIKYADGEEASYSNRYDPSPTLDLGPKSNLDRADLSQSFNFILPTYKLDGNCELTAEAFFNSPIGLRTIAEAKTTVFFKKTNRLKLALILVNDTVYGNPAPNRQAFDNTFKRGIGRAPLGDTNFTIYIPTNHQEISTRSTSYYIPTMGLVNVPTDNLKTETGWSNLLDRLDDIADDYDMPEEVIWAGLVPKSGDYYANGMATSGFSFLGAFWHKRLLNQNGLHATLIHELSHTLGIEHAKSVDPTSNPLVSKCDSPDGVDNSLKSLTEDIGVNIDAFMNKSATFPHILPKGVPTLMTYCVPLIGTFKNYQNRWVSIDLWNRLKNFTH